MGVAPPPLEGVGEELSMLYLSTMWWICHGKFEFCGKEFEFCHSEFEIAMIN